MTYLTLYPCKSVWAASNKNSSTSIESTTENLVGLLNSAGWGNNVSSYRTQIIQEDKIDKEKMNSTEAATNQLYSQVVSVHIFVEWTGNI